MICYVIDLLLEPTAQRRSSSVLTLDEDGKSDAGFLNNRDSFTAELDRHCRPRTGFATNLGQHSPGRRAEDVLALRISAVLKLFQLRDLDHEVHEQDRHVRGPGREDRRSFVRSLIPV